MMVVEANRPRLIELIVSVVLGVGAVIAVMIRYTSDISYASIQSFCSQALDSVANQWSIGPIYCCGGIGICNISMYTICLCR